MALDKLVDSTQLNADLTSIANAIRTKGGTAASLAFPQGFVSAVEAIETGGGGYTIDDLASTGITGNINIGVGTIKKNAFAYQNGITGVSGANVSTINEFAFAYCENLVDVDLPNLVTTTGRYVFRNCNTLGTVHLPKLKTVDGAMFYQCGFGKSGTPNTIIVLPALENTSGKNLYEFFRQGRFAAIDIGPGIDKITGTFYAGTYTAVILRRTDSIVAATNTDAVQGLSNVWVPLALISSYTSATNWSTRIAGGNITLHAIEGSIYENAYADGTPISA